MTFDEALQLVPMDDEQIRVLLEAFQPDATNMLKKTGTPADGEGLDVDWAEYRICAAEMGMSEEEFFNCDPSFLTKCTKNFGRERK